MSANAHRLRVVDADYEPEEIDRVKWSDFMADQTSGEHAWLDDQHYTMIGPNGCGKTTLARELLTLREYVTLIITKPRDRMLDRFVADGYKVMREWKDLPIKKHPRRMLWPKLEDLNYDQAWQRYHIETALDQMFPQGGWNIYLDEVRYVSDELRLRRKLNLYLLQYRALGGSLLASTQRPSWIPREFYSQSQHLVFWQQKDANDLQRIAGIGSLDNAYIRDVVAHGLKPHEFLYLHIPSGYMCISMAPNPDTTERR